MKHYFTATVRYFLLLLLLGRFSLSVEAQITLPLEVIGADGYTETVTFSLDDASGVNTLYLKAHRLAYRDASTNPSRGAKGSVRLNDGPWINLDNSTVNCYAHEQAYGCLSGAYQTVRLTLPISGAKSGTNTLRFRFNGTDGFTSGYRILQFNLMRNGQRVLPNSTFTEDNPADWTPPRPGAGEVQAGKQLWQTAQLQDFPGGPAIKATCEGCHARDGRDLEYYAFSNRSIQERAKFHGLDQKEAEQIASYIRSLKDEKGIQRYGRPWNPPYQPGPGLDNRSVKRWAAGAGLNWVLERDQDMIPHLFPEGTSQSAVREALSQPINHRELPLAIQLPDWQAWLPEVHPVDALGETAYYATAENVLGDQSLHEVYQQVHNRYEADPTYWRARGDLQFFIDRVHGAYSARIRPDPNSGSAVPDNERARREVQNRSVRHWASVKQWEVMQEYDQEDKGHEWLGTGTAEAPIDDRQWLTDARNVFELAPHRTAGFNNHSLVYQNFATGKYFSTAWYELQVVLNKGVGFSDRALAPVDWNYQPDHIANFYHQAEGHAHPLRLGATIATQTHFYASMTPQDNGWGTAQMHPARYMPQHVQQGHTLDALPSSVRGAVYDALLANTMDLFERFSPAAWRRTSESDPHRHPGNNGPIEPASYLPKLLEPHQVNHRRHIGEWANTWYTMIPVFREAGVRETTLNRVINWGKSVWPRGDWEALRGESVTVQVRARMMQGASDQLTLHLDGQPVHTWTVSGSNYATYSATVAVGDANLKLYFADTDNAKDMQIDYLEVDGVRYQTEDQQVNTATYQNGSCGGSYSDRLYCQGYVDFGSVNTNARQRTALDKRSLEMQTIPAEVNVYPNPSRGQVTVTGVEGIVKVYNLMGIQVGETVALDGKANLDLSGQAVGMYSVQTAEGRTYKLMVEP